MRPQDEPIWIVGSEGPRLRRLRALLAQVGYPVELIASEAEALERVVLRPPSAAFLDWARLDTHRLEVCHQFRKQSGIAIIVLSTDAAASAAVTALQHGADDYITDACGPAELLARLRAALRRARRMVPPPPAAPLVTGVLRLEPDRRRVTVRDHELYLPPREYDLLYYFMSHAGEVIPAAALQHAVWGAGSGQAAGSLRVCIASLRRKLERAGCQPSVIQTIRRVGYCFAPLEEATG